MQKVFVISVIGLLFLFLNCEGFAELKLAGIFGDNMVLQQNRDIKIWGTAQAEEKISVICGWNTKPIGNPIAADLNGEWSVILRTPQASGPYKITVMGSENTVVIDNILIGEVWLCSGQSNMVMPMQGWEQPVYQGEEEIKAADNNAIRLFIVPEKASDTPLKDVTGKWVVCKPETVKNFSAAAYFFGKEINSKTGYPVGLIQSAFGGTFIHAWIRIESLENDDQLHSTIETSDKLYSNWKKQCEESRVANLAIPPIPVKARNIDRPAALYNAMIAPFTSFQIKGVIWYQGESEADAQDAYQYRNLFPVLINNWRCDFENFDMPFYFVQLASFCGKHIPGQQVNIYQGEPRNNSWAELREAQLRTCQMKNTGMAVTIDIGETNNIHPCKKKDVGHRLALWALANIYNKEIDFSGPLYAGYRIERDKIRIFFKYAESGLISKGKLAGFAIAGKNRKFVWADARIEKNTIIVSSKLISEPVAVRYGWDIYPKYSLYDTNNLPASPFRTDDWVKGN
jgi:sialate O-acetylesterase